MVHSLAGRRQRQVEISNILYAGKGMAIMVMLFQCKNRKEYKTQFYILLKPLFP